MIQDAKQLENLKNDLILDEGFRAYPYKDVNGFLTIGIGRNIDKKGISLAEARGLLQNDIVEAYNELVKLLPWIVNLNPTRQNVLINLAFNLGVTGLMGFKNMLENARKGDFKAAGDEIIDSKAGSQLKNRYERLAYEMEFGKGANDGLKTHC